MAEKALSLIKAEKPGIQSMPLPEVMRAEIEQVKVNLAALYKLMEEVLQPGIDFDRIPGTDKPALHQPGAQILGQVFKLAARYHIERAEKDLDREPPFVAYQVRAEISNKETGAFLGEGVGSANSLENKHRWRKVKDENGNEIRIENTDVMTLDNTLLKMAKKRALVDATLNVTGASRLFTQDAEDLGIQEQIEPASSKQINFLRTLAKKRVLSEEDLLAAAAAISGRELRLIDELSRPEASALIDSLNNGPLPQNGGGKDVRKPEPPAANPAEKEAPKAEKEKPKEAPAAPSEPPKSVELEAEFAATRTGERVTVPGKGDSAKVVAKCLRKNGPLVAGKVYTLWVRPGAPAVDAATGLAEGEVFRARLEVQKGIPIVSDISGDVDIFALDETA